VGQRSKSFLAREGGYGAGRRQTPVRAPCAYEKDGTELPERKRAGYLYHLSTAEREAHCQEGKIPGAAPPRPTGTSLYVCAPLRCMWST